MIPLFTSIPPRISRKDIYGAEIGQRYALDCVRSWRNSGFEPISVNSRDEDISEIIKRENITLITNQRDAKSQVGKPLIFLGDMISAAFKTAKGPVAFTNADIILDVPAIAYNALANLRPGQCFVGRRHDLDDFCSRRGTEYKDGYDFFALHSDDLGKLAGHDFVFGVPWWDHYLPIMMFLSGLKSIEIADAFVFHLTHVERWNTTQWISFGSKFIDFASNNEQAADVDNHMLDDYNRTIARAVNAHNSDIIERIAAKAFGITRWGRRRNQIIFLRRIALANVEWIDQRRL